MNKLLRVMFILVIVAMSAAAILQLFFPTLMGANSEYGTAGGWQREIAFWNMAVIPFLVAINIKYDPFWLKLILVSLIVGGLGFGTNHLIGFITDTTKMTSLIGAFENYAFVACWIIGWQIENKKLTKTNHFSDAK